MILLQVFALLDKDFFGCNNLFYLFILNLVFKLEDRLGKRTQTGGLAVQSILFIVTKDNLTDAVTKK